MRSLSIAMNVFKKGWILSVLSCAMVLSYAQDNSANKAKGVEVRGSVTDAATHQPLSAIRVTYEDYSAAITDSTGNFILNVPNYDVTVVLQGEGYQSKEIALKGRRTVTASLYE